MKRSKLEEKNGADERVRSIPYIPMFFFFCFSYVSTSSCSLIMFSKFGSSCFLFDFMDLRLKKLIFNLIFDDLWCFHGDD